MVAGPPRPRSPTRGVGWSEVFLDATAAGLDTATALATGHSILVCPDFASTDEIRTLLEDGLTTAHKVRIGETRSETPGALSVGLASRLEQPCAIMSSPGRVRMPVVRLGRPVQSVCDALLLRALELLDTELPDATRTCFGERLAPEFRATGEPMATSPQLQFTHNEPAINVYTAGGCFCAHKDLQSLTVLVPLTGRTSFDGGGTAFWAAPPLPEGRRAPELRGAVRDVDGTEPTLLLAPPAGTALLFGGDVTHAGQPVTAGQRAVFVASFSRRDGGALGEEGGADEMNATDESDGDDERDREGRRRLETILLEQMYS